MNETKTNYAPRLQEVYSIFDSKANTYSRPMFEYHRGRMLRMFIDLANDKQHPVGQHPEDYYLYCIGTFDENTGKLTALDKEESLGKALDFAKQGE